MEVISESLFSVYFSTVYFSFFCSKFYQTGIYNYSIVYIPLTSSYRLTSTYFLVYIFLFVLKA